MYASIRDSVVSSNRQEKQIAVYSADSTKIATITIVFIDTGFGIAVGRPGIAASNLFYFNRDDFSGFDIQGPSFDDPRGRIGTRVRDIDGDGVIDALTMLPDWTDGLKDRDIRDNIITVIREQVSKY